MGRSEVFHLAETPALSELDWARRIGASCGWNGELHAIPAELWPDSHRCQGNMRQHWELDSTAIRRDLGYAELFSPEDALARTIEWELANPPVTPKADSLPYPDEDELVQRWLQSKAAVAG